MSKLRVCTTIPEIREAIAQARAQSQTIGLAPTMGALHAGHASLIHATRQETRFVVVSIFVNPTQFGPNEDLNRYPRTFEADRQLCEAEGADAIFMPSPQEMYPPPYRTYAEVTGLQDGLCGATRPGHFRGVVTVVLKLFNIVTPDIAYFGQKDAQQGRIIEQMASDLNLPVRIRICPIVRESDGLALSSRNRYLDPTQRQNAVVLFQTLQEAQQAIAQGERNASILQQAIEKRVNQTPGAVLDYASLVAADSLQPVTIIQGPVLIALAVKFGDTRLIDNVVINVG